MEKLTEKERLAVIAQAVENVKANQPWTQPIEDFVADIRSEEVFTEHGLLDAQKEDIEDESSLMEYDPSAESIDEEDESMGLSDEMRGVYS